MVLKAGEKTPQVVIEGGADAHYLPTGHLVYNRGGSLLAVRFDLSTLKAEGTPVPVVEGVPMSPWGGPAFYSVSDNGTLLYLPGGALKGDKNLVLLDRRGTMRTISQDPQEFFSLSVSPNGGQVVVRRIAGNDDLWIYDLAQGAPRRLTSEPGDEHYPVWTPNGMRIAFGWRVGGTTAIYWTAADGTGAAEELSRAQNKNPRDPSSFSPDGKTLAFVEADPKQLRDVWTMSVDGDRKAQPFPGLATNADEWAPQFSPNGRWLAYVSNETGRNEVYVRPSSPGGAKIPISTDGGTAPIWARKKSELFYLNGRKIMSAMIDPQSGARESISTIFELKVAPSSYDIVDDDHFLMSLGTEHPSPTYYNLVLNWFSELQQRIPVN
jgi:serine/threonine-protein kinase